MDSFILRGNVIHSPACGGMSFNEHSYLICLDGVCAGVFPEIPDEFRALPLTDYDDKLIIPGMVDLHLHAPQHPNLGLGMDLELLDWLNGFTFPTEAKFADLSFAADAYGHFAKELMSGATTRASIFGTIHPEATLLLMELLENSGLHCNVGKVNMDQNSPDILCEESDKYSLSDTMSWLLRCDRFKNIKPILTPRFAPSCSSELMGGLGKIATECGVPIQSHLSENAAEIEWVASLHPDCPNYASVYKKFGLLTPNTIMAHCVRLTEDEVDIIRNSGTYIAHCPVSNTNIRSGIAPIRKYMNSGLNIGLGSDISGGHSLDMFDVMREALGASKLYWCHVDENLSPLQAGDVFRLATIGGGGFFGKVGCFDAGYELDAIIIDDSRFLYTNTYSLVERFERMIYLCSSGNVNAKYVAGNQIAI